MEISDKKILETMEKLNITELPDNLDLVDHMNRKIPFSDQAFGPGRRTNGILEHIQQEDIEVRKDPEDVEEWIDIAHLALDGAWRCLRGRVPEEKIGGLVAAVLEGKLQRNIQRSWPDYRTMSEDQAINHQE